MPSSRRTAARAEAKAANIWSVQSSFTDLLSRSRIHVENCTDTTGLHDDANLTGGRHNISGCRQPVEPHPEITTGRLEGLRSPGRSKDGEENSSGTCSQPERQISRQPVVTRWLRPAPGFLPEVTTQNMTGSARLSSQATPTDLGCGASHRRQRHSPQPAVQIQVDLGRSRTGQLCCEGVPSLSMGGSGKCSKTESREGHCRSTRASANTGTVALR